MSEIEWFVIFSWNYKVFKVVFSRFALLNQASWTLNLRARLSSFGHCKVTAIKRLQSDCMCDKMRF